MAIHLNQVNTCDNWLKNKYMMVHLIRLPAKFPMELPILSILTISVFISIYLNNWTASIDKIFFGFSVVFNTLPSSLF